MVVAKLDNLVPGHTLQSPLALVLVTLVVLHLVRSGRRTILGVPTGILSAERKVEDTGGDAAHRAKGEGRAVSRQESGHELVYLPIDESVSPRRVLVPVGLGRDDTSTVTGREDETHSNGLFV